MKIKYDSEGWTIVDADGNNHHVPPHGLLVMYGATLMGAAMGHTQTSVTDGLLVPHSHIMGLCAEMEQARTLFENKDIN